MNRQTRVLIVLWALLLALIFLSIALGRYGVGMVRSYKILTDPIFHWEPTWDTNMVTSIWNLRLPRIFMACLVGACLSGAGAAYQGVFQNPMASPDVLGASSGAAMGAAIAILLGLTHNAITLVSFLCAIGTVAVVYAVGCRAPGSRILNLVLCGMVISSLCSAGTSYVKLVADPNNQLPAITYWLLGSLNGTTMDEVWRIAPVMALGMVPLVLLRWKINLLTLGEEEARALGVHPGRLRLLVVLCATLMTAASIAVSGMIGWVGLVMPHLCRRLVGNNFRALLPASMVAGALFLLLVDDLSRNLLAVEIPIGILTAVLGAPFFLVLLLRGGRDDAC